MGSRFGPMSYQLLQTSSSSSPSSASSLRLPSGSSASEGTDEEESPLLQHQAQGSDISIGPLGCSGYVDYEEAEDMTLVPTMATRFGKLITLLETDHEPGLTNAQLLLINDDLKPGMVSVHPPVTLSPFCVPLPPRIYNRVISAVRYNENSPISLLIISLDQPLSG